MAGPRSKKLKLDSCLICSKEASHTEKQDVYTKVLINHLIPPSMWEKTNRNVNSFSFCNQCEEVLENLCQLKDGLDFILKSIKNTLNSIKYSILENNSRSVDITVENFRKMAVIDFCPKVNMSYDNALANEPRSKSNGLTKKNIEAAVRAVVPAQSESPILATCLTKKSDSDNVEVPDNSMPKIVPFPTVVSNSSSSADPNPSKTVSAEPPKITSTNIEDSIIVVTQPPKFVIAQWNVYYENYKDMYKCKFCSTIMKGENINQSLARHINIIHAKNNRFKCGVCFGMFFSKNKCRSHIGEVHYEMFNLKPPNTENETVEENLSQPSSSKSVNVSHSPSVANSDTSTLAKKKTAGKRKSSSVSVASPENTNSSDSTGEKYADDKIRSEVVINLEPKTKYTFMEDIVKFEPWDESSGECATVNPLEDPPEMTPTEETKNKTPNTVELDSKPESEAPVEQIQQWPKPNIPRSWLGIIAIKNLEGEYAFSWDIYDFVSKNYPFFQTDKSQWKKSIHEGMKGKSFKHKMVIQGARNEPTKVFAVDDEKISKMRILIRDCLRQNVKAMAFPESLADFIQNIMGNTEDESEELGFPDTSEDAVYNTGDVRRNPREGGEERVWTRPALTYLHLAVVALSNSEDGNLATKGINDFIATNFPFFDNNVTMAKKSWRNYISSVLPRNPIFLRSTAENLTPSWKLNLEKMGAVRENIKNILMVQSHSIYWSLRDPDKFEQIMYNTLGHEIDMDYVKSHIGKSPLETPPEAVLCMDPIDPNQYGVPSDDNSTHCNDIVMIEDSMEYEETEEYDESANTQFGNIEVTDFKFEQAQNRVGQSQAANHGNVGVIEIDDHSTNQHYVYTVNEDNTIIMSLKD